MDLIPGIGSRQRYALFRKPCEEAMQRVADQYTELFDDMVHLFAGRQAARRPPYKKQSTSTKFQKIEILEKYRPAFSENWDLFEIRNLFIVIFPTLQKGMNLFRNTAPP